MSLIHDYLKKTEIEAPATPAGVVPPSLFGNTSRTNQQRYILPVCVILVAGIAVGAYFQAGKIPFSSRTVITSPPVQVQASSTAAPPAESLAEIPSAESVSTAPVAKSGQIASVEESMPEIKTAASLPFSEQEDDRREEKYRLTQAIFDAITAPVAAPVLSEPAVVRKSTVENVQERASLNNSREDMQQHQEKISRFYQAGLMSQKEGNLQAAENIYNNTLQMMPAYVETLTNLSAVLIKQGKFRQAEETINKILQLDPGNSKAQVNLGMISLKLQDFPEARERFHKALEMNPAEESALVNLAYIAQKEGDVLSVEKYYRDILGISPRNKDILLAYGGLLENSKRFSEAQECYRRCLELDEVKENTQLFARIKERVQLLGYY